MINKISVLIDVIKNQAEKIRRLTNENEQLKNQLRKLTQERAEKKPALDTPSIDERRPFQSPDHSDDKKQVPCQFYQKGICTRDEKCKFVHDVTQLQNPTLAENEVTCANRNTKLCTHYQKRKCQKGDACTFAHGESELRWTDCWYKGFCKNSECIFKHPEKTPMFVPVPVWGPPLPDLKCRACDSSTADVCITMHANSLLAYQT